MRTVILGPPPHDLTALLARRSELGQDLYDEVWEGEYHMSPAPHPRHGATLDEIVGALREPAKRAGLRALGPFNLGSASDYRVPDYGYVRSLPPDTFVPTAALVVEVVSPDDETFAKFAFYARHDVDELLTAEPLLKRVKLFVRRGHEYAEVSESALLGIGMATLAASVDWP